MRILVSDKSAGKNLSSWIEVYVEYFGSTCMLNLVLSQAIAGCMHSLHDMLLQIWILIRKYTLDVNENHVKNKCNLHYHVTIQGIL